MASAVNRIFVTHLVQAFFQELPAFYGLENEGIE